MGSRATDHGGDHMKSPTRAQFTNVSNDLPLSIADMANDLSNLTNNALVVIGDAHSGMVSVQSHSILRQHCLVGLITTPISIGVGSGSTRVSFTRVWPITYLATTGSPPTLISLHCRRCTTPASHQKQNIQALLINSSIDSARHPRVIGDLSRR